MGENICPAPRSSCQCLNEMYFVGRGLVPRLGYNMFSQRKHPRLDQNLYQYPCHPCSLTIAVKGRQEVFGPLHDEFTKEAINILEQYGKTHGMPLHIALFMPDHVHICAEASPHRSLIDFMGEWKNLTTRLSWQYGHQDILWQTSFFDHFLRKEENISTVVRYILNNPLRAKLATHWWEYPYWYSNQYTIEQLKNFE